MDRLLDDLAGDGPRRHLGANGTQSGTETLAVQK
jgi:hypothetical protein